MALDKRFIPLFNLGEVFNSKTTGVALANGTIEFYRDSARTTLKAVYELTGNASNYTYTALPNPITLDVSGQIVNGQNTNVAVYTFPYEGDASSDQNILDLYYIVVKDSSGVVQFTRQAVPSLTDESNPTGDTENVSNQLANPQFARSFINAGINNVYTATAASLKEFAFAPGWSFFISGTGTVTVQLVPVIGNENIPTTPPFVLDVAVSSGITECRLTQRFNKNSGLWSSTPAQNIFLSGNFVARNEGAGSASVELVYEEQNGNANVNIINATLTASYVEYKGVSDDPIPGSTSGSADAYVDIYLRFFPLTQVRITSIQALPTTNSTVGDITDYDIQSSDREQALLGSYYIPQIETASLKNLLPGWNFIYNPFQFQNNISTTAQYVVDQTIAKSVSNTLTLSRNTDDFSLSLISSGAGSFYLCQYIYNEEALLMLGRKMSVYIDSYQQSGNPITVKCYILRGLDGTATFPTLPAELFTMDVNGNITVTATGWSFVNRGGLPAAQATMSSIQSFSTTEKIKFNNWEFDESFSTGAFPKRMAVVLTFSYSNAVSLNVREVTLNRTNIAFPSLMTKEETFQGCQRYYETSYKPGDAPGTISFDNVISAIQTALVNEDLGGTFTHTVVSSSFVVPYRAVKAANPTITFYDPVDGAQNKVRGYIYIQGALVNQNQFDIITSTTNWDQYSTTSNLSQSSFFGKGSPLLSSNIAAIDTTGNIVYHFAADARPGVTLT